MQHNLLTKRDAELLRGFRVLIAKGKFEIQGAAAKEFGQLFQWFETLDKRIESTVAAIPLPPPEKPPEA